MTSPIPPRVSDHETVMSRLAVPSTRIFVATIILATGTGVSAVFWKMPKASDSHALYNNGVADPELAMVPLPNETSAAISHEEMQQIILPDFDIAPVAADGAGQYAQVYPAPGPLAMANMEHIGALPEEKEPALIPVVPQEFKPMREMIDEKPISVEPVNWDFAPMPTSMSTTERSDELLATFHFVENSRVENNRINSNNLSEPPADPFPLHPADPFPIANTLTLSTLPPLQPLQLDGLSPLLPLREIDLQSFAVQ